MHELLYGTAASLQRFFSIFSRARAFGFVFNLFVFFFIFFTICALCVWRIWMLSSYKSETNETQLINNKYKWIEMEYLRTWWHSTLKCMKSQWDGWRWRYVRLSDLKLVGNLMLSWSRSRSVTQTLSHRFRCAADDPFQFSRIPAEPSGLWVDPRYIDFIFFRPKIRWMSRLTCLFNKFRKNEIVYGFHCCFYRLRSQCRGRLMCNAHMPSPHTSPLARSSSPFPFHSTCSRCSLAYANVSNAKLFKSKFNGADVFEGTFFFHFYRRIKYNKGAETKKHFKMAFILRLSAFEMIRSAITRLELIPISLQRIVEMSTGGIKGEILLEYAKYATRMTLSKWRRISGRRASAVHIHEIAIFVCCGFLV